MIMFSPTTEVMATDEAIQAFMASQQTSGQP
jgi:hypothetical protein